MMNRTILLCLIGAFSLQLSAQTAADRLYRSAIQLDDAYKLDVQKPLISMGIQAVRKEAKDEELADQIEKIGRYIKRMKILVLDDAGMKFLPEGGRAFINELKNDHFEEYMTIRHETSRINIMVREKKEKIRNILFLIVDDEEGLVMLNIKAKLPIALFEELDFSL